MSTTQIINPRNFFDEITKKAYEQFSKEEPNFLAIFQWLLVSTIYQSGCNTMIYIN
jgi:hypothetical protein